MAFFDTDKQRAALLIVLLAVGVFIALAPYATGLLGAPVLFVIFSPMHHWLATKIRPAPAAAFVILCAFLLIVLPGVWLIGMLVGQAQSVASGLVNSRLLERVSSLRIGQYELGPELAGIGRSLITWLGGNAIGFIGTATHFTLNLIFSFFGLYYLLLGPAEGWRGLHSYIPFSHKNVEILAARFRSITLATMIGTGVTAFVQGVMIGTAFWLVGLSNPVFWGVVTMVFAILPIVGSGIIWIPGAVSLALEGGHTVGVIVLIIVGLLAGQIHTLIGPWVFKRYSQIDPMITLVGAIAGVSYFGLLGLLIGPLALSYFFELIRMYREEYLTA
jgi:predicted PurR-regulated permease PerM